MEIFAGFSIRPRSTPCPTPESLTEWVETGSFFESGADLSFAILSGGRKNLLLFERSAFEQQQVLDTVLSEKRAGKAGQTEKQSNRKLVRKGDHRLHFII